MLVRLLYASRASETIDAALVGSILRGSEARNREHGITGILCSYPEGGVFLQALEGARREVNALYGNIVRDTRHRDVTLLRYAGVPHGFYGPAATDLNGRILEFLERHLR